MHLLQVYYNPFANQLKSVHKLLMALKKAKSRSERDDPDPRKRAIRLREEEIDRLVARFKEVRNMRTVALEFRMSRETVAKHLAARGIDTFKSMKPTDIKRAKELYAQGMGSGRIGRMLGFDNKTVLKELKRAGVALRLSITKK